MKTKKPPSWGRRLFAASSDIIRLELLFNLLSRTTLSVDLVMSQVSNTCHKLSLWAPLHCGKTTYQKPSTCPHAAELRSPLRGGTRQYVWMNNHDDSQYNGWKCSYTCNRNSIVGMFWIQIKLLEIRSLFATSYDLLCHL